MYALSNERRLKLMHLSLLIVCGSAAVLPFTTPPASAIARAQLAPSPSSISVPDVPGKLHFPEIFVERDPFVADAAIIPENMPKYGTASGAGNADEIGIVLPPNTGARGGLPDAFSGGAPIVRGIVLGGVPQALVDVGNGVKVYSVGDAIGTDVVKSIDAGGIILSSGVRLTIAHVQP